MTALSPLIWVLAANSTMDGGRHPRNILFTFVAMLICSQSRYLMKSKWSIFAIGLMCFNFFHFYIGDFVGQWQFVFVSAGIALFMSVNVKKEVLLNSLATGALIQVLFIVLERLGVTFQDFINLFYGSSVESMPVEDIGKTGTFGHSNILGSYLLICLPSFFRKKIIYIAPLVMWGICQSRSHLSIYSSFALIAYYLWMMFELKPLIPYIAFLTVGSLVISANPTELTTYRTPMWRTILAAPFFQDKVTINGKEYNFEYRATYNIPKNRFQKRETVFAVDWKKLLIGGGLGWFRKQAFVPHHQRFNQEHSEYMGAFTNWGLVGLAALLLLLYQLLQTQIVLSTTVFAFILSFYGHFTMHIATTSFIFICLAATIIRGQNELERT